MAGVSAKLARWIVDPLAPPSIVRSLVIGGSAFGPYHQLSTCVRS
jgi:hypothetical protein